MSQSLYKEDLDATECKCCHKSGLESTGTQLCCSKHVGIPLIVEYLQGNMILTCPKCNKEVATIVVAHKGGNGSNGG